MEANDRRKIRPREAVEGAEDAADVKRTEVVRGAAGVEKNAADEKTGEDEEEIDTAPAGGESGEKSMWPETQRGMVGIANVMTKYDEQDGEAAEAVELGDAGGKAERAG
jgi:hypothetical protein